MKPNLSNIEVNANGIMMQDNFPVSVQREPMSVCDAFKTTCYSLLLVATAATVFNAEKARSGYQTNWHRAELLKHHIK
ncbi:MAG: hypothetical protein JWM96_656 [Alphaproteobacteria bacterium]|nr:hypothetical protein [Alphaproteobacteria bacterium]